jgi:GT2 family glycosyltransferase
MAQFDELRDALRPYGHESNADRVTFIRDQQIVSSPQKNRQTGLSIIVLNKDTPELISQLWENFSALAKRSSERNIRIELLLGDTGSTNQETLELLNSAPHGVRVTRHLVYQFSRCNNQLFNLAKFSTVLFLNNDVLFGEAIDEILDAHEIVETQGEIGVLGAVLHFPDGLAQHVGVDFLRDEKMFGHPFHPGSHLPVTIAKGTLADVPAVTGAFMMMRSVIFESVDGFDERYSKECQDIDLCLRVDRLGKTVKLAHAGNIIHIENGTRVVGEEDWKDRSLFIRRWSSYIEATF